MRETGYSRQSALDEVAVLARQIDFCAAKLDRGPADAAR